MSELQRINPFTAPGIWLKGAVHVHTVKSDGCITPDAACAFYAARGYDFICFGDHWHITQPDDAHGLIVVPGCEIDTWRQDEIGNTHIMCIGARHVPPRPADSAPRMGQQELWELAHAIGVYAVMAHPYWSDIWPDRLARLPSVYAIEVYNHGTEHDVALGQAEYVWDMLLNQGFRVDALAVDDAHWRHGADDAGGGFIMVKAQARTPGAIVDALRAGAFYASMGPRIEMVELAGACISVRTSPARAILFRGRCFYGSIVRGAANQLVTTASYELNLQQTRHVRVRVEDDSGRYAWTNPFYL